VRGSSFSLWERARVRGSSLSLWERARVRGSSLSLWERARVREALHNLIHIIPHAHRLANLRRLSMHNAPMQTFGKAHSFGGVKCRI